MKLKNNNNKNLINQLISSWDVKQHELIFLRISNNKSENFHIEKRWKIERKEKLLKHHEKHMKKFCVCNHEYLNDVYLQTFNKCFVW